MLGEFEASVRIIERIRRGFRLAKFPVCLAIACTGHFGGLMRRLEGRYNLRPNPMSAARPIPAISSEKVSGSPVGAGSVAVQLMASFVP